MRSLRRLAACLLGTLLLAPAARATWSIVVVDVRTGEVAVASATCLANFQLQPNLALVRVGHGAAAAQSVVDQNAVNRQRIWEGFDQGKTPRQILGRLSNLDSLHQRRQYGIVTLFDPPVTFSGAQTGAARAGLVGELGDLRYAIQGNLLTAPIVVDAAERALRSTDGDLSQRVMAGMQAARAYGGDGRCSCSALVPTSCGAPPPGFTKSAHTAFFVQARLGDVDGTCGPQGGCANGDYYLDLQFVGGTLSIDAVEGLQQHYDAWRSGELFAPDHFLSTVTPDAPSLVADGQSSTTVRVVLRNVEGEGFAFSTGWQVEVEDVGPVPPVATAGAPLEVAPGVFDFDLTATTTSGAGAWRIWAVAGADRRRLWPDLELAVVP